MVGSIIIGGLLILTSYSTEAAVVFVSSSTGKDTIECLSQQLQQTDDYSSYIACATLDYALQGIHQHLVHRNVSIVLNATNSDDQQSSAAYYVSCNRTVTTWNEMATFELTGYGGIAHIECAEDTGFAFSNSSNIRLVNVSIEGCALIQNSTSTDSESMNPGSLMKYKQFFVAVYFLLCDTVTLDHVTISGTKGVALVLYGTRGVNTISSCKFFNNTSGRVGGAYNDSTSSSLQGGGGIAIEFVYCIPGDVNCNQESGSAIPSSRYSNVSFRIIDCKFLNNYGQSSENSSGDAFIIPNKNHNVALGRGGGLGIVFKGKASNNSVVIDSCDFIANEALWGGGALFEFQDNAQDNIIQVKSTNFISNKCHYSACNYTGTGGGGIRVLFAGFDSLVKNNSVLFSDVKFESNEAYFGGGTSLMTFPEIEQTTNAVTFSNVTWINNTARVGSAVDLSVWHLTFNGSVIRPVFLDSTFETNTIHYTQSTGVAEGAGTVYADTVPIAFSGNTTFKFNNGSCVYVVEADVEFLDGSYTEFKNNTADSGAAISLHGNSYMLLSNGSDIVFASNTADLYGGAINWIAAGNRFLISSRNCFIRYKDYLLDPKKWPVLLTFDNNHAGITGDDIFGTTLLGCLWGGQPFGKFSHQQKEYSKVFNWSSSIWYYKDGDSNSIATSPGYFITDGANKTASEQCSTSNSYSLEAIPGSYAGFNTIMMNNDKQSPTPADALVFAVISSTSKSSNENESTALSVQYVSPSNDMLVNGSENEVRYYTISTLYPRIISSKVTLTFSMCPLGFMPAHNNKTCIGGNYLNLRTHTNFSISLQRGYWIGRGNNNRTITAQCFFCPFNKNISHLTDSENYILISDTTGSNTQVQDKINHILCDGLNRVGNFCETCKPNYSPAFTSETYECVKCDSSEVRYAWIIYILRKFLPITIALFFVIVFGVSVTSGPANSFVLFAQVISTTFAVNVGQTLDYTSIIKGGYYSPGYMRNVYISLYSIWNLDFFETINGHTCLGQNISTLNLLSFKYITACYPLLILLIIAILIKMYDNGYRVILCLFQPFHRLSTRCIRAFDINRSIMDAFATFLVLSYVKFAVTSALLLYPLRFTGEDGETVGEPVSFFQPSINFWSKSYAPYLAVSLVIFVFVCFCLPVVLFLYSLRPFYSFLENHRRLQFLVPGEKFKLFLNSFYHCYKDGRDGEHDRRYFCSFYFFAQLLLIFAYSYSSSWIVQLIAQQVICTFAIAVVSIFQPYKNQFYNIVDSLMFSILAVINTLTLYQIHLATAKSGLSLACYCIQVIFVFIPILYILGFVSHQVYLKCHQRVQKQRNNNNFENDDVSRNFSYGEFMQEVQNEGRFEQMNPSPIEEEERNAYVNVQQADPSGGGQQCSQTTVSIDQHDLGSTEEQQQQETRHQKRRACTTTGLRSKQQRLRHKRNTNPTSARSELVPLLH